MQKVHLVLVAGLLCLAGVNVRAAETLPAPLPADRWMEIDLYWFDRGNIEKSCHDFWLRFAPLYEGVEGWRGVILNVGWTVDYVMDWSGDLHQKIVFPNHIGQEPWCKMDGILRGATSERIAQWKERFAHPVPTLGKGYEPWTYGDLKLLAETLRRVAEQEHGLKQMRVGVLTLGWQGIYGGNSPWGNRHPEAFVGGPKGMFVGFLPATKLNADHTPTATLPGGIPQGMPLYAVFAQQWGHLSKAVGLDGVVLRDSMLLPLQYERGTSTVSLKQARFYHEGAAAMVRETKKANRAALVLGYSNGVSAMSDWRCNGVDLEAICKEGHLDAWIDQSWAGAWNEVGVRHNDFWNGAFRGWTYQLAQILLHAAMLADTKVHHYPLVETFDAWESWDIIDTAPERLKWGIWAYSHAAVKTPRGVKMPIGTYISWANQGTRLLDKQQVGFLTTEINAAVRDALATTEVCGPTMVYCRDAEAWQMTHAPQKEIKEWLDEQIGTLAKWSVPISSVTRVEYLPKVKSDVLIVGTPVHLQAADQKTLVDLIEQGQPMMLVGSPDGGIAPELLQLAGIEPLSTAQRPLCRRAKLGDVGTLTAGLPSEFETIQFCCRSKAASDVKVLYSVDGSPALTINTSGNRKLIYWDPPTMISLWGRPLIEDLGGVESYVLAARAVNTFLPGGGCPWPQTIAPRDPVAIVAWRGSDGVFNLLAGNVEEGLNLDVAKSRKVTREQMDHDQMPKGLDLYVKDKRQVTLNLPAGWRADSSTPAAKTVDIDLRPAGSVRLIFQAR